MARQFYREETTMQQERTMREVTVSDVPESDVGATVQDAVDAHATKIEAKPSGDGTWTVVTTFPN
jgi:hypothetical protein